MAESSCFFPVECVIYEEFGPVDGAHLHAVERLRSAISRRKKLVFFLRCYRFFSQSDIGERIV